MCVRGRLDVRIHLHRIRQACPAKATRAGLGLAFTLEEVVAPYIAGGGLVRVLELEDWCAVFPGYHLYYPSRRQPSPAFSLVDALRYRG